MTEHSVVHATFTLEREYAVPPARVFEAWSDPAQKARWFSGGPFQHDLDFRIGGREINQGHVDDGKLLAFESFYREIVPDERIVYTSTLSANGEVQTVSMTTVQLSAEGKGTRLVLTEQGAYLDGNEEPAWREQGTGDWLDKLGTHLQGEG